VGEEARFNGSGYGPPLGFCEHGTELSGFKKKKAVSLFFRTQLLGCRSWKEGGRQPHSQVPNYRSAVISCSTTLPLGVSLVASSCAQRWHDTRFRSAFSPRSRTDILSIGQQV